MKIPVRKIFNALSELNNKGIVVYQPRNNKGRITFAKSSPWLNLTFTVKIRLRCETFVSRVSLRTGKYNAIVLETVMVTEEDWSKQRNGQMANQTPQIPKKSKADDSRLLLADGDDEPRRETSSKKSLERRSVLPPEKATGNISSTVTSS